MRDLSPGNRSAVTAGIFTVLKAPFNLQLMKLNALVMSRSHSSIRVLVAAFAELGIEYRISPSASETMEVVQASRSLTGSALVARCASLHA